MIPSWAETVYSVVDSGCLDPSAPAVTSPFKLPPCECLTRRRGRRPARLKTVADLAASEDLRTEGRETVAILRSEGHRAGRPHNALVRCQLQPSTPLSAVDLGYASRLDP